VGDDLEVFGTSPLSGGRMRIGVRAKADVAIGTKGSVRVELYRPGASTLSDERDYRIVEQPKPKEGENQTSFPQFDLIPVDGPDDENWMYVAGEADDRDVKRHASSAQMTEGTLYVYYSTAFPGSRIRSDDWRRRILRWHTRSSAGTRFGWPSTPCSKTRTRQRRRPNWTTTVSWRRRSSGRSAAASRSWPP
jgi:hypothetical protein